MIEDDNTPERLDTRNCRIIKGDAELVRRNGKRFVRFLDVPGQTLRVHVLRTVEDYSNGGVTSREEYFTLLLDPDKMDEHNDETALVVKATRIGDEYYLAAVPVTIANSGRHPMASGNHINSSDSRYPVVCSLPVHDRLEP